MHKKDRIRATKDINCADIFFREFGTYIEECEYMIKDNHSEENEKFIKELRSTLSYMGALRNTDGCAKCEYGSLDELVYILEQLRYEELDQLLNCINMHILMLDGMIKDEEDAEVKDMMENTRFDIGVIFDQLCKVFKEIKIHQSSL